MDLIDLIIILGILSICVSVYLLWEPLFIDDGTEKPDDEDDDDSNELPF